MAPTKRSTVKVPIQLTMSLATLPTGDYVSQLKKTVALNLGVTVTELQDFVVTATPAARRRRLTGGYDISVSSTVVTLLAATYSSGVDLAGHFASRLQSATFSAALASGLGVPVTVSTVSSQLATRCTYGEFSPDGLTACAPCASGTYGASAGLTVCTSCAPGLYSPSLGATSPAACVSCSAGTYQPVIAASGCSLCSAGQYQSDSSSTSCLACPAGTASLQPGATDSTTCTTCFPGTCALAGASACASCLGGFFGPTPGASSCDSCASGLYSPITGATASTCLFCDPGSFSLGGAAACPQCPGGTYNIAYGLDRCTAWSVRPLFLILFLSP